MGSQHGTLSIQAHPLHNHRDLFRPHLPVTPSERRPWAPSGCVSSFVAVLNRTRHLQTIKGTKHSPCLCLLKHYSPRAGAFHPSSVCLFSVVALPAQHYTVVTLKHCNYSSQIRLQLNKNHHSNGQVSPWHFPLNCKSVYLGETQKKLVIKSLETQKDILVALSKSESSINPL